MIITSLGHGHALAPIIIENDRGQLSIESSRHSFEDVIHESIWLLMHNHKVSVHASDSFSEKVRAFPGKEVKPV